MKNDDEDSRPVYRRCLTTFLDILGFKQLIRTQSPEFVHRLLDDLKRHATPNDFDKSELDAESLNFSDCVVRSIHVESEHNLTSPQGILWYELFGLAWIQGCVIYEFGVFPRGAITVGDLYIDAEEGIVFGPALNRAYKLESEDAVYPRILIDPELYQYFIDNPDLMGASHHDAETDKEFVDHYVWEDKDGKRFLNYLSQSHIGDVLEMLNVLDVHYDQIVKAVEACNGNEKALEKYRWVADYHNQVVMLYDEEVFEQFDDVRDNYLLTESKVPGLDGWAIALPETESGQP